MSAPNPEVPQSYEIRPDPSISTKNDTNAASGEVDYEPQPSRSQQIPASRQKIVDAICRLYSGSASEEDMQVYDEKAVYDDPWSYCDTRYKIAGQWYGIATSFSKSETLKTEVVENTDDRIIFKLRQAYTPKVIHLTKEVDSLVTLTLDKDDKVKYHKDMWNEKDYSHEGLGKIMKTLNGDHLTKITRPPKSL